jgi:hypothetical protein
MLVHLLNPETERRDGEETGARPTCKEFAEVKADLIFPGFDSRSTYDWMVELAIRAKPPFCDPRGRRVNSQYLDTQAMGRTPARDIDCMNGYSAGHLVSCPLGSGA